MVTYTYFNIDVLEHHMEKYECRRVSTSAHLHCQKAQGHYLHQY